jgi:hypothetical protein
MALVDDAGNVRSIFPLTVDTFTARVNGGGNNSIIDAETWNRIETAILRAQRHDQSIPHFFDAADRQRVCLSGTTTITSGNTGYTHVLSMTTNQRNQISNQLLEPRVMVIADAFCLTTSTDLTTEVALISPGSVSVTVKRVDPTQTLPAGTYLTRVTVLGR